MQADWVPVAGTPARDGRMSRRAGRLRGPLEAEEQAAERAKEQVAERARDGHYFLAIGESRAAKRAWRSRR